MSFKSSSGLKPQTRELRSAVCCSSSCLMRRRNHWESSARGQLASVMVALFMTCSVLQWQDCTAKYVSNRPYPSCGSEIESACAKPEATLDGVQFPLVPSIKAAVPLTNGALNDVPQ